jgi:hypothetical protein
MGGGRREKAREKGRERKRKEEKERLGRGGGGWDLFKMVDRVGFCLNRSEYPIRTRVAPCNLSYERRNCKHEDLAVRGARSAGFEYLPSGCCRI